MSIQRNEVPGPSPIGVRFRLNASTFKDNSINNVPRATAILFMECPLLVMNVLSKINHSLHDAAHHPENMKLLFSEQSTLSL
jgi:hypothetical protein